MVISTLSSWVIVGKVYNFAVAVVKYPLPIAKLAIKYLQ